MQEGNEEEKVLRDGGGYDIKQLNKGYRKIKQNFQEKRKTFISVKSKDEKTLLGKNKRASIGKNI